MRVGWEEVNEKEARTLVEECFSVIILEMQRDAVEKGGKGGLCFLSYAIFEIERGGGKCGIQMEDDDSSLSQF